MNKAFKVLCTILMMILILILVWVLVNYYKDDPYVVTPINNIVETNTDTKDNTLSDGDDEPLDDLNGSTEEEVKLEDNITDISSSELPNNVTIEKKDPVVITSSENTSNMEKQEVLNEIDKALMELLQVVDRVKPVDETRLGIDESEVQ